MTDLHALAGRVEGAAGPSEELDALIRCALWATEGAYVAQSTINGAWCVYLGERNGCPRLFERPFAIPHRAWIGAYTASLDAAMLLVPEGFGVTLSRYWIAKTENPVWSAELSTGGVPSNPRRVFDCYDAATPALALTAASLRAIASDRT